MWGNVLWSQEWSLSWSGSWLPICMGFQSSLFRTFVICTSYCKDSSTPLFAEDIFQDPQGRSSTDDNIELYIWYFPYVYIPVMRFNLWIRHSKSLIARANNKIEELQQYTVREYLASLFLCSGPLLSKIRITWTQAMSQQLTCNWDGCWVTSRRVAYTTGTHWTKE
jgi:hypothetical protein